MKQFALLLLLAPFTLLHAAKPNFVFVLGDDINRDSIGCYGGGVKCNTPNIDQLAADGVKFANAYTSVAMCAPFRQELYSGRTPWRTKSLLNHSQSVEGTKSLPHYLKPLGYEVALAGKTHFGPQSAYPFKLLGGAKGTNEDFMKQTTEFIESAQAQSKPFCLFICSSDAHGPYTQGDPSPYKPESLNIPPYWIDTPTLRKALPPYLAEVANFDALVGKVRSFLDQNDLAKDTVFFACTEQGSAFPFAKWTCFDNGLHTGLVAYSPGRIPSGHVSEELLWMCDLAPTFVELAGGEFEADDFDGRSQLANLTGNPTKIHDHVFGAFSNKGIIDNRERIYPIRAIRDNRFSLIWSPKHDSMTSNVSISASLKLLEGEDSNDKKEFVSASFVKAKGKDDPIVRNLHIRPEFALFDRSKDPYELSNLAENPEYAPTLEKMKSALFQFLEANDDADPVATETTITQNKGQAKEKGKRSKKGKNQAKD